MVLSFSVIAAAIILLAAIVYCVLGPYSHMSRIWWISDWVGNWADRHPLLRNFPPFAAFSALLFFVWNLLFPASDIRPPNSGCLLISPPAIPLRGCRYSPVCLVPLGCPFILGPLVLRRAALCFCAVALLGVSLEFLQQLVPERAAYAHPLQILWSVFGALAGAFGAASLPGLFCYRGAPNLASKISHSETVARTFKQCS